MDTTDKDLIPPQVPDLQAMSMGIVQKEGRYSIELSALLGQIPSLTDKDTIKIYRLSNRDVERGQPALTKISVLREMRPGLTYRVSGTYESSDDDATRISFDNALCSISASGEIKIFTEADNSWLIIKRATDPALIFIDRHEKRSLDVGRIVEFLRASARAAVGAAVKILRGRHHTT